MKFSSMIYKNIKFNIKSYFVYFYGIMFINTILFMFFNIINSNKFIVEPNVTLIKDNLSLIITFMALFSIVFIGYTTISFTRYRGKEIGVYYTIGLAPANIMSIFVYENICISLFAFVFGSIFGSIFSRLFNMAILRVLSLNNIDIGLNFEAYRLLLFITVIDFFFTSLYQYSFIKRNTIMDIIKADSRVIIKKANYFIGAISIIGILVSIILYNNAIIDGVEIKFFNIGLSAILMLISLYFFIGFGMLLFSYVSKRFERFYNNNIFIINSLKHRFINYNGVLYVVTLLVIGGMLFISTAYCNYTSTIKVNSINYKNDLSFIVEKQDFDKDKFKKAISESGADINRYYELENLLLSPVDVKKGDLKWIGGNLSVVSLSNYNKLTNKNEALAENQILYLYNENKLPFSSYGLLLDYSSKSEAKKHFSALNNGITLDQWKQKFDDSSYIYIENKDIKKVNETIDNMLISPKYLRKNFIVIDDHIYNKIKMNIEPSRIQYDILADLNNSNEYYNYKYKLSSELSKICGDKVVNTIVIKSEKLYQDRNVNGFTLFICSFLGIILLLGSGIVLYFKTFSYIERDKKDVKQLVNIGLNRQEISIYLIKEMCVIFLIPPILALLIVLFYIIKIFNIVFGQINLTYSLATVFGVYLIIQISFGIFTTNKYVKTINVF